MIKNIALFFFIISGTLFTIPTSIAYSAVTMKFDQDRITYPNPQTLTLTLQKELPGFGLTDVDLTLEIVGPATFTENKLNKLEKKYNEIDTKEEKIGITLDNYAGVDATILINYQIVYHTKKPISNGPYAEEGSAQFIGIWSDKTEPLAQLAACNTDKKLQEGTINNLRSQFNNCQTDKSSCLIAKTSLGGERTDLMSQIEGLQKQLQAKQTTCDIWCSLYKVPIIVWIIILLIIGFLGGRWTKGNNRQQRRWCDPRDSSNYR